MLFYEADNWHCLALSPAYHIISSLEIVIIVEVAH
jgi:preprotein translocase subunit Sec61beta